MLQTIALCFICMHVIDGDDVVVAGRRHEDVGGADDVFQHGHLIALHRRLQCVDGSTSVTITRQP